MLYAVDFEPLGLAVLVGCSVSKELDKNIVTDSKADTERTR